MVCTFAAFNVYKYVSTPDARQWKVFPNSLFPDIVTLVSRVMDIHSA